MPKTYLGLRRIKWEKSQSRQGSSVTRAPIWSTACARSSRKWVDSSCWGPSTVIFADGPAAVKRWNSSAASGLSKPKGSQT
ncbi:hypothetical protein DB30_08032 [Enhygromyxa salina]|uniref:Uncharacterized protein n=1 Tax=Enhygromyxa salina TaxID=215803 RepID=A0A0C2CQK3_9BACT|nr:hypothetical protein DB30_08032 [Enhygromyxa salina]